MITLYNTYQVRTWSRQTGYLGSHRAQKTVQSYYTTTSTQSVLVQNALTSLEVPQRGIPSIQLSYRLTLNGWSENFRSVPCIARHFWSYRDQLSVENGVLIKSDRVCIPPELQDRTLYDLHDGHLGVEKMTHLARSSMYWQGINSDIIDYVRQCTTCAKHKALQSVQPMLPRDVPEGPWQEIATDYFTHSSKDYLLIADTFSKYSFVYSIHSKTHNSLIQRLQDLFSQFGTPLRFFSDNGPPFSSEPFASFLTSLGIEHITSSPLYPQSNGFIERQIKTIKTALTTAQPSGTSITHTLKTLHSTPIGPNLPSPHKILMNRTSYRPGHQPTHVDLDQVRDYLITQSPNKSFITIKGIRLSY